ncbi:Transposase, IS4 family related (Transposase, IS4 family relatedTransposase, IS4 family relatedTransposase, IS4 family relatedTransposase, IS4 family related) [Polaromonas sp. CG9_12]|nr:Transposase, IS4 family related (Transposase, IS4 family relatedTransposase, IS4 family relatedTransposase, IS4 family relatedTransposase, IS4 family related) [Polaromonas sp. CG9_12]
MSQDKQIWSYFHCHWRAWFPMLGARSTFVRQAANLWAIKQCMHRHWVGRLGATKYTIHLVDGFPVPVCHFRRAHFSQVFRGEATFGHYASKAQTYYGFKAVLLTSGEGVIENIALFGAHVDERDGLVDMDLSAIKGMLLGDKGFIRPILKEDPASQGIDLNMPLRSNMKVAHRVKYRNLNNNLSSLIKIFVNFVIKNCMCCVELLLDYSKLTICTLSTQARI